MVSTVEQTETLIGKGLTSEVFGRGEDRVLKLFFPWVPESTVQREFDITRTVHAAGAPCPAAFEMLKLGDRHGIIFERGRRTSVLGRFLSAEVVRLLYPVRKGKIGLVETGATP